MENNFKMLAGWNNVSGVLYIYLWILTVQFGHNKILGSFTICIDRFKFPFWFFRNFTYHPMKKINKTIIFQSFLKTFFQFFNCKYVVLTWAFLSVLLVQCGNSVSVPVSAYKKLNHKNIIYLEFIQFFFQLFHK